MPTDLSSKLHRKHDGLFYIAVKGSNPTYRLRRCEGNKLLKSMINANRLKLYHPPDHRPDLSAPPPDEERPEARRARREEPLYFEQPSQPPNPNSDTQDHNVQDSTQNTNVDRESEESQADQNSKQFYDVEKLLRVRKINGEYQFLVEWVGFKEKTWEPEHYIPTYLIRKFIATKTHKGTRRKRFHRKSCLQKASP